MDITTIAEQLRHNPNLTPRDILTESSDISVLVAAIEEIFKVYEAEIETEELFRENLIQMVNYVYLELLSQAPHKRNKKIFPEKFINALLMLPNTAH